MVGVRPAEWARFSQRAIWLRLPPMRPTASTSAGSTRGAGLRRRASVRPRASRRRVATGTPAASAFCRSSAFSAAVQRNTKVSVSAGFSRAAPAPVGFEGEACHPSQGPVSAAPAYDTGRLAPCSSRMTLLPLPGVLPGKTAQLSHLLPPFRASPWRGASGWNPEPAMVAVHRQGQASVECRQPFLRQSVIPVAGKADALRHEDQL